ncbi:tetratricopeptide repeat protein [Aureispira anguillae]|uniref:Tetratricopeptide repeat protein n=1 Tax=Aureispira anguillae TaxID=2864201 RepID=A0A915YKW0_9BACT|nr:hypothetical protein [Aureispira anguillae]BDS15089.1 hypothetical protein AsAng_0058730 [Aureispira anguillae]
MDKEQLLVALEDTLIHYEQAELEVLSKQAVTEYPTEAFGYYYLSEALILAVPSRYNEAEVCLAKALEIEPDSIDYMTRFCRIKELQGRLEDAQIMWGKILRKDPNNTNALIAKAGFQLRQYQDYQQALDLLNQAIQLDATNLSSYLYRAEAFNGLSQHEAALGDLNIFLEQEEAFNEAAISLKIKVLKDLGRNTDTFPLYESLLQQLPNNHVHQFNYGQELLNQEQFSKAVEHLRQAAELVEEQHSMFYRTLGEAALYALELDQAIDALQKCIELNPQETEAFLMLIEAKIEQEEYAAALADADLLLQKATDDKSLTERVLLQKGRALTALNKHQEAEATFMPLAKAKSLRQKEAFYGLGMLYEKKGETNKAYRFMKAAKAAHHPLAQEYIKAYFQDFLQDIQTRSLKANEAEFAKNAASPVLQKLFGKLWKFQDLDSQKLADLPTEYAEKMKLSLAMFSMVFTETGAILVADDKEELLTYRIKKEAPSGVLVEFLPLDNFPSFMAKLRLAKDGISFSKEENEVMYLAQQDLSSVPAQLVNNYKKHLQKEKVAYLGNKATAILDQLL